MTKKVHSKIVKGLISLFKNIVLLRRPYVKFNKIKYVLRRWKLKTPPETKQEHR